MSVKVTKHYVDGKYGQLHLRMARGSNAGKLSVICLHLSPVSGQVYEDVMPYLAENGVVIAPDYPGFGESDPPPPEPHIQVSDFAEMIWQVVEQLTHYPVHLVGYHTGAYVAAEAATQYPDRIKSIVSISAPIFTPQELAEIRKTYSHIPLDEAGTRIKHIWDAVMHWRGPGVTFEQAARSFAEHLRAGENYEWGHRAAFDYAPQYTDQLSKLRHPLLVINPEDDLSVHTRRVDQYLKNGKRVEYPQWGHGFLSAYPQDAAKVILDFIESVERS